MVDTKLPKDYVGALQLLWYGHTNIPQKADFELAWKAVKAVAAADGKLSEPERLSLLGKMCAIGTPLDVVETVMKWDEHSEKPAALLAKVGVPEAVRAGTGAWIVYEAMTVSFADGVLAPKEIEAVRSVAATMGVAPATVDALHQIVSAEAAIRQIRISTLHGSISEKFRFGKK